ncbi:MAG: DUF1553 domain-containing protein [Blastocatellia bacterium]
MSAYRHTPGAAGPSRRAMRAVTLSLLIAALLSGIAVNPLWDAGAQSKGNRAKRTAATPPPEQYRQTTPDDCSYLKDPLSYRDAQAHHRLEVSNVTARVSERVAGVESTLVNAADIPRKNFIDTILFNRMQGDGVASAPLCTDAEFIRRVTLDMTGRIPAPDDVLQFLADDNPAKRDMLIERLIGTPEYVDKWTNVLGDLLKNNAFSANIDRYRGGRDAFYRYIKQSVQDYKPWDKMAAEMIAATGDSFAKGEVNFIIGGHVTGGPIQDVYDGYTVHVAQTFLGLNSMDCLLCHDGQGHLNAINVWGAQRTRVEAWGMAAFFARTQRVQTQQSTGSMSYYHKHAINELTTGDYLLNTTSGNRQTRAPINGNNRVTPKYMLSGEAPTANENRRAALARYIVSDPQFARAFVNYIWENLMVEGLVSPSNAFDLARLAPGAQMPEGWTPQPANPELLDALARDFAQDSFNMGNLLRKVVQSSAYQLSSRYDGPWRLELVPYYARKFARRLDGEEVHDAIIKATGIMPTMAYAGGPTLEGYTMVSDVSYVFNNNNTLTENGRITWAMQLPEPVEPRSNGIRAFMDSFIRGDRDQKFRDRSPSILQTLNMMNNGFVMNRIHRGNAGSHVARLLVDTTLTNDQIMDKLYLATLSRLPNDTERTRYRPYFTSLGKQGATETLQWVLLNKVDFIFNY